MKFTNRSSRKHLYVVVLSDYSVKPLTSLESISDYASRRGLLVKGGHPVTKDRIQDEFYKKDEASLYLYTDVDANEPAAVVHKVPFVHK